MKRRDVAYGPSRHFATTQHFGRFRSEADISGGGVQYRSYDGVDAPHGIDVPKWSV